MTGQDKVVTSVSNMVTWMKTKSQEMSNRHFWAKMTDQDRIHRQCDMRHEWCDCCSHGENDLKSYYWCWNNCCIWCLSILCKVLLKQDLIYLISSHWSMTICYHVVLVMFWVSLYQQWQDINLSDPFLLRSNAIHVVQTPPCLQI